MEAQENTKERIEKCAVKEFLEKGFNGASLRRIVKEAGVTTGAFYKYYPTKEALFEGLVGPVAEHIYGMYDHNYEEFTKQGLEDQIGNMNGNSRSLSAEMINYAYEHLDAMKLILTSSEGTPYEQFEHNLSEKEARSSIVFAEILRKNGQDVPEVDEEFAHMAASGYFGAFFEVILHDMKREDAIRRVRMLGEFYTAGWEKFFGITFGGES